MSIYDRSEVLISLHVPKTAGLSLQEALRGWFGDKLALHYRGARGERPEPAEAGPGVCVHGHFNRCRGLGALDYYPEASQFIVFLRNPFDRFVSQWRYLHFQRRAGVAVPELDDQPSFAQWLDRRRAAAEAGEDPFSFLAQLPRRVARAEAAFGPEYLFVGLTERYGESLAALADALGFPRPAPAHVNRATDPFRGQHPHEDHSAYRRAHEQAFPLEYAVYESARAWLRLALETRRAA